MTMLTINNTASANTSTITIAVQHAITDILAALNYGVQFETVGASDFSTGNLNNRAHRLINIDLEGAFFNKDTAKDLHTWYEFKASITVQFKSADDEQPTGSLHGIKVTNHQGHDMIAAPGDVVKYWSLDEERADATLSNLAHYLVAKSNGHADMK